MGRDRGQWKARVVFWFCAFSIFNFWVFVSFAFSKKIMVGVSIPPQKYFVEKIGGNRVKVIVLLPSGANPAVYEPKPKQMCMLSKTRVFFSIGVPFEIPWLKRIKREFSDLSVVPMYKLIKRRPVYKDYIFLKRKDLNTNPDPHVWLSPPLVRIMGMVIFNTLKEMDPEGESFFYRNYKEFAREVTEVDNKILDMFEGVKKREFLVFHPSWGYFARTYGLIQVPLEVGGKTPSLKEMGFFVNFARKRGLKVIFVQPQFSLRFAKALSRLIGGRLEIIDPLAENWRENLLKSASSIARSLK